MFKMRHTLKAAAPFIVNYFDRAHNCVYRHDDLDNILLQKRTSWQLAKRVGIKDFVQFLTSHAYLQEIALTSSNYRTIRRFVWRNATPHQVALSRSSDAYLSHATAAFLHGLIPDQSQMVFVNREQSPKSGSLSLTQGAINRAFSHKQRQTNLVYEYDSWKFIFLNGKNTDNLGVEISKGLSGEPLRVTNIERTLIDIVVRPSYAGGPDTVLDCYKSVRSRIKVIGLITILKKLHHAYPYHQAIGFYMQKAGYAVRDYEKLRSLGLKYDFYLAHDLKDASYDRHWRLFYPKGM